MLRKLLVTAAAAGVLSLGTAGAARAQSPTDNSVFFTFNHPITLPHTTLPAGRYLFQLARLQANRQVVQVFSDDRAKLYGTFMTIPADFGRDTPAQAPGDTGVTFIEAPANAPQPVRSWWYPGRQQGWEFIYPKSQARMIAKTAKEPVLASASDSATTSDQMSNAPLERISPSGEETPVNGGGESAGNNSPSSSSTAVAQNESSDSNAASGAAMSANPNDSTAMNSTRTRLPKTASDLPIVALAGMLSLMAGLGLAWKRRVA